MCEYVYIQHLYTSIIQYMFLCFFPDVGTSESCFPMFLPLPSSGSRVRSPQFWETKDIDWSLLRVGLPNLVNLKCVSQPFECEKYRKTMENYEKIHHSWVVVNYFDWAIFNSYVNFYPRVYHVLPTRANLLKCCIPFDSKNSKVSVCRVPLLCPVWAIQKIQNEPFSSHSMGVSWNRGTPSSHPI